MKTLKPSISRWVRLLTAGLLVAGFSGAALAGIAATKHNLSTSGTGTNHLTAGSGGDQICVFCHTPHGSNQAAAVPLWNKALPASTLAAAGQYQTYNSTVNGGSGSPSGTATSSIDGRILNVGSVSIACLSCHDGTQAMDNMINKPGSGGYSADGTGALTPVAAAWAGNATMTNAGGAPFPNLGKDLTNDHPIGIEYCGGGITASSLTTCADADFNTADLKTSTVNGQQIFWVDKNPAAGRQKDDIVLYTRDFSVGGLGGNAAAPSVECASCHDPHVESKGNDNIAFMRISTEGSKICLACHTK